MRRRSLLASLLLLAGAIAVRLAWPPVVHAPERAPAAVEQLD